MLDREPRAVAELHRLPREGEGAGDHRLGGDDRRGGGERDQRIQRPARGEMVERIRRRRGVAQQQRPLAEIVEHEAGQRNAEPGQLDGVMSEVPQVGVQRFAAGHHEKHRAEHHEAPARALGEEPDRVQRGDRR